MELCRNQTFKYSEHCTVILFRKTSQRVQSSVSAAENICSTTPNLQEMDSRKCSAAEKYLMTDVEWEFVAPAVVRKDWMWHRISVTANTKRTPLKMRRSISRCLTSHLSLNV